MYPLCRFRPWSTTGCPFCGQSYPYDGVPRPFFGTEWPCRHSGLPSRMCARTFPCSGRGSCSLRTPRPRERAGASFFLELQDAIERVWEERHDALRRSQPAPLCPPRTAGKLRPSGPTAGVPLRNGGMAYTRNPMPTPHGLRGGPLSGLSRPPRTRQLALYPIISCRISEIRHADRI